MKTNKRSTLAWALIILAAGGLAACSTGESPNDDSESEGDGGGGSGSGPTTTTGGGTESGVRICNTAADCGAGLTCEHSSLGNTGVCAVDCATDGDCASAEMCVGGSTVGFDSSCLQRCSTAADCGAGLGCAVLETGAQVCLPSDWIEAPPAQKGLGDACSGNTDCKSGMCAAGFCTEYCSSTDSLCYGDYGGKNEFGAWNWCVLNSASQYICFPGCSGQSSVCGNYDGTTCQAATDVEGYSTSICAG